MVTRPRRNCKRLHRAGRLGSLSAELAVVTPVLALLLFGIVDFGLMFRSKMQLTSLAELAARAAASGETPGRIAEDMAGTTTGLEPDKLSITLQYRGYVGNSTWDDAWYTVGTIGERNSAPLFSKIRAVANDEHQLVVPGLFHDFMPMSPDGKRIISAEVSMLRTQ